MLFEPDNVHFPLNVTYHDSFIIVCKKAIPEHYFEAHAKFNIRIQLIIPKCFNGNNLKINYLNQMEKPCLKFVINFN